MKKYVIFCDNTIYINTLPIYKLLLRDKVAQGQIIS